MDECCDPAIAAGLRRRNVDVPTSREAGLLKAPDEKQDEYGLAERRVIVTHDADFLRLHTAGVSHMGIMDCPKDALGIGEIIKRLVLVWEIYEPEELTNRIEFL